MLTLKNNADQFKPWTKYTWLQAISKYFERLGLLLVYQTISAKIQKNLLRCALRIEMERSQSTNDFLSW